MQRRHGERLSQQVRLRRQLFPPLLPHLLPLPSDCRKPGNGKTAGKKLVEIGLAENDVTDILAYSDTIGITEIVSLFTKNVSHFILSVWMPRGEVSISGSWWVGKSD